MASKTQKVDPYQVITDRIIEQLDAGVVPWRKPWRNVAGVGPTRLSNGQEYKGINVLLLSIEATVRGYTSVHWGTYKQIGELGGQVRKGERSTEIVFYKTIVKKGKDGEDDQSFRMLRFYNVFNIDQADWADGSKRPAEPTEIEPNPFTPIETAERIANEMPLRPTIKHGGDRAAYSPALDYVMMPNRNTFDDEAAYYATLFHELVHSTGHSSRIGREGIEAFAGFGSESYSKEELIAEMGAAYLCAEAGIEPRIEQNAAYIASWLKALKNDRKMVAMASSGAGKAADFILGKSTGESA